MCGMVPVLVLVIALLLDQDDYQASEIIFESFVEIPVSCTIPGKG